MDQQQNYSLSDDILGLKNLSLLNLLPSGYCRNNHTIMLAKVVGEKLLKLKPEISDKEMEIRGEIEREIERDLEEEIKGGIYQQALRLQRLYKHQGQGMNNNNVNINNKELLEINISIKMEGGTKVEIKETRTNKQTTESYRPRTSRSDTAVPARVGLSSDGKRLELDWVKSLRRRAGAAPPPPVGGRNICTYRTKMRRTDHRR